MSVVVSMMVLAGCSNKDIQVNYPQLTEYEKPGPIKLEIVVDEGKDKHIESLEKALTAILIKVKEQSLLLDLYKNQAKNYNAIVKGMK